MVDLKGSPGPSPTSDGTTGGRGFLLTARASRSRSWTEKPEHIWVVSLETGVSTQVTFAGVNNDFPVWTRDGKSIIFSAVGEGHEESTGNRVDGSGDAESLGVEGKPCRQTSPARALWSSRWETRPPNVPSGRCLCPTGRPWKSSRRRPRSTMPCSLLTGTGWHTSRMRQGDRKSTCGRTRSFKGRNEGCQKVVAPGPYGRQTARRSTIEARSRSWSRQLRSDPASCPADRGPSSRLSDSGSPATRPPSTSIPMASGS